MKVGVVYAYQGTYLKEVWAWAVVKYFWFSNNGILLLKYYLEQLRISLSYQRIKR